MKSEVGTKGLFAAAVALAIFTGASISAPIEVVAPKREDPVDFGKEIYPMLKRNCLACHNTTKAKGGLNLESPQLMLKGGDAGPGLVAGKGLESLIVKAAAHLNDDLVMPPPGNKSNAANLTPNELGLLKLWIDQGAKGDSVADAKGPLPWRVVSGGPVNAVAFSPDARLLAVARGNRVELCEVATGRELAALADPELAKREPWIGQRLADRDAVMALSFGSDDLLATGGFREVRLWRRQPRTAKRELGKLAELPTTLAASADGKWVAAGDAKGSVWLVAMDSEKFEPVQLKEHATAVTALAFSPDSKLLVSTAEDKAALVWSVAEKKVEFKCATPELVRTLTFAGSEIVAGCADGVARVWQWQSEPPAELPKPAREFKLQDAPLNAFTALQGEKGATLVWAGVDSALHFANASDGKEQRKLTPEHPESRRVSALERELAIAQGVATTRKSQTTSSAEKSKKEAENAKKTAQDLEKARTEFRNRTTESDAAAETARLSSQDKGAQDAAKKTADIAAKAEKAFRAAKVNAELGSRMASDAAGALASADAALANAEAAVAEFSASLDAAKKQLAESQSAASRLLLSSEGKSVMLFVPREAGKSGAPASLRHIALENGTLLEPPDLAGQAVVLPASLKNPGDLLSVGADGVLRITSERRAWTLERVIGNADDPTLLADRVTALAFSPNGKLLATGGGVPSRDGELKIWRTSDGTLAQHVAKAHADTINAISFSADGDFLATASSDRLARIWKTADGSRVASLEGHSGHVLGVAWRADGLALATGGADRSVRTWDFSSRKMVKKSDVGGEVSALAYAGVGDTILTALSNQTRLGDQSLPESPSPVFCAASDLSGKFLAAGGLDGVVRLWAAAERKVLQTFAPAKP